MDSCSPLISVIICSYNQSNFIAESIYSVLQQNYENYELVVVDDGSVDNSRKIIGHCFESQPKFQNRFKIVFQENQGQTGALVAGVRLSSGSWVCFLDGDDRFRLDKLSTIEKYIRKHPNIGSIWHRSTLFGQEHLHRKIHNEDKIWPPKPKLNHPIKKWNRTSIDDYDTFYTTNSCLCFKMDLLKKIMQYDYGNWPHKHYGDIFFDRPSQILAPVLWIPDILTDYRIHDDSHHLSNINVLSRESDFLKKQWIEEKYSLVNNILEHVSPEHRILLQDNLAWLDLKLGLEEISIWKYFRYASRLRSFWMGKLSRHTKSVAKNILRFLFRMRS